MPYSRLLHNENDQHLQMFLLYVGEVVEEIERMNRSFCPNDNHNVILSGVLSLYGAESRMLESSSNVEGCHKPARIPLVRTIHSKEQHIGCTTRRRSDVEFTP